MYCSSSSTIIQLKLDLYQLLPGWKMPKLPSISEYDKILSYSKGTITEWSHLHRDIAHNKKWQTFTSIDNRHAPLNPQLIEAYPVVAVGIFSLGLLQNYYGKAKFTFFCQVVSGWWGYSGVNNPGSQLFNDSNMYF